MKLIRKRVRNSDRTCAVMFISQSELEILQAIVSKAELHTPKIPDTEKVLNRLKSMRITLSRALGQWDELPIVDEIVFSKPKTDTIDIQKIVDIIEKKLEEQERVKRPNYYRGCEYDIGLEDGKLQTLRIILKEVKDIVKNFPINIINTLPSSEEIREHLYGQLKAQIAIYSGRREGGLAALQDMFYDLNNGKDIVCECCNQKIMGEGVHKKDCEIVTNYFNVFNK